ncbi:MAG: bifunctional methylenetetrahydrofolate dehydrogenase/methenyltetrahydrofolate cyclohydrolase FolD [Candidatus Marinimicrobia bacterium]|jgi:methylenetetrahydrofolate dehydrogenase (NADP+)/methenyltetrahydrofolate cyclohydrolase|nr:bifunctional methylenetetrahydrofolate dehydrogenase/methenyltetrahydrofolate cyclohydrolase FolD [Candidatus Neomarinimicrobiota bacterium]MDP7059652.1 bifunctional methylenetetrahydrofolate dehydrogenase/methenyltetrahydrofolate cyclohydrolase FolD [Candidatus Neomarinimicrobiota bacterium]|tara:strand:+ start:1041 stop:1922 length:882 start_codon:yes stop_codon:yes gene_type:complete
MTETIILSGKEVASAVYDDLSSRIDRITSEKVTPGLAAVLVGDDPASQVYVRNKRRRFENMGLFGETFRMGEDSSESNVLALINDLNGDDRFHGILIQLPLPKGIDSDNLLRSVRPDKDVDGFHPENIGLLAAGNPRFIPCTPKGILRILQFYNIETSGKHAVIVGRSNIVGRPMALMLSAKTDTGNATVTVCHSRTPDIAYYTRQADIVIAAAGMPSLIKGDMIKDGTVIIDVGINRVEDDSKKGYKLSGDVDYESVMDKASAITPVPGGVGPMTIAMLVENTVEAAERLIS